MIVSGFFAVFFLLLLFSPVAYAGIYGVALSAGFFFAWTGAPGRTGELLKRWLVPLLLGLLLALLRTRELPAFRYDLLLVLAFPVLLLVSGELVKGRPAVFVLALAATLSAIAFLDLRAHGLLGRNWDPIRVSRGPIVCLGDSLTAGVGATPEEAYPALLARALGLPVINAGVPGDTSGDALRRLEADVLAHHPEAVILLIGGNDLLRRAPRDVFERNLHEMLARLRAAGIPVLLVQQASIPLLADFSSCYRQAATRHGALLLPNHLIQSFYRRPNTYIADSIHWNARAHREFADELLKYLEKS